MGEQIRKQAAAVSDNLQFMTDRIILLSILFYSLLYVHRYLCGTPAFQLQ